MLPTFGIARIFQAKDVIDSLGQERRLLAGRFDLLRLTVLVIAPGHVVVSVEVGFLELGVVGHVFLQARIVHELGPLDDRAAVEGVVLQKVILFLLGQELLAGVLVGEEIVENFLRFRELPGQAQLPGLHNLHVPVGLQVLFLHIADFFFILLDGVGGGIPGVKPARFLVLIETVVAPGQEEEVVLVDGLRFELLGQVIEEKGEVGQSLFFQF